MSCFSYVVLNYCLLWAEFDEDGFEKIELNAKNMPHCEDPDFNVSLFQVIFEIELSFKTI